MSLYCWGFFGVVVVMVVGVVVVGFIIVEQKLIGSVLIVMFVLWMIPFYGKYQVGILIDCQVVAVFVVFDVIVVN